MNIKNDLVEEFKDELSEVSKLEIGSEKHKLAVDSAIKIADRIIELEKIERETDIKESELLNEDYFKSEQLKNENRDRKIRNAITIGTAIGGWTMAAWAHISSMRYEKDGIIPTTEGGRIALKDLLRFRNKN